MGKVIKALDWLGRADVLLTKVIPFIAALIGIIAGLMSGAIAEYGFALTAAWVLVVAVAIGAVIPLAATVAALLYQRQVTAATRRPLVLAAGFVTRPIPGQASSLFRQTNLMFCQLAVRNDTDRLLPDCSVRLETIQDILNNHLLPPMHNWRPARLEWAPQETSRKGNFFEFLDIPPDGQFHTVEVATVDKDDDKYFTIWAADPRDRLQIGPGWFKFVLVVSSNSETPYPERIELLFEYHPRRGIPAPLVLKEWREGIEKEIQDT